MRRLGPGPVFWFECRSAARRWQGFAGRTVFLLVVLITLMVVDRRYELSTGTVARFQNQARQARIIFDAFIAAQITLLMLAAPAATAGAVALEKSRGSIAHIFVTDLSDAEIVLGKLAARLVRILGLLACAYPVTAALILMGGIEPKVIAGAFGVCVAVAVVGCALGLTLSVWARKTHQVLLVALAFWGLCVGAYAAMDWLFPANRFVAERLLWLSPYFVALGPLERPDVVGARGQLAYCTGLLWLSLLLVTTAVWKIRPVTLRQLMAPARRHERRMGRVLAYLRREVRWLTGPILDINPVAWREWHRRAPTRAGLIVRRLYTAFLFALMTLAILRHFRFIEFGLAMISGAVTALCLLMLGITAATSLTEERVQGGLDVLMVTPLSTGSIVWGKWWGIVRGALPLAIPPFVIAYAPFLNNIYCWEAPWWVAATIVAQATVITSLGLALAVWLKRTDRAVVSFLVIYALATIGAPVFGEFLSWGKPGGRYETGFDMDMVSPFFAVATLTDEAERNIRPISMWQRMIEGATLWLYVLPVLTLTLYGCVTLTFDRCLGRVGTAAVEAAEIRWIDDKRRVGESEWLTGDTS
jgi:ABC-type transport system involved in multi-copper enzyme maturation permease subunit